MNDNATNQKPLVTAGIFMGIGLGGFLDGITLSKIELELEGDINVTAVWGVGDLDPMKKLGFIDVRVKVHLEGDASEAELKDLVVHSNAWSPVANTLRNPVNVSVELV